MGRLDGKVAVITEQPAGSVAVQRCASRERGGGSGSGLELPGRRTGSWRSFVIRLLNKELNMQFVLGYGGPEFTTTLHSLAKGESNPSPLITGKVGVEGIAPAFATLARPSITQKSARRAATQLSRPTQTPLGSGAFFNLKACAAAAGFLRGMAAEFPADRTAMPAHAA